MSMELAQHRSVVFATDRCHATFATSPELFARCHCSRVMHSGHEHGVATTLGDEDEGLRGGLLREAEFAVASAISVREQQKDRLLVMLAVLSPPSSGSELAARQPVSSFRRGQANPPPSLHVLGDVLLLLRAASVNVVERIQEWRQQLHQGKPQPYLHNNRNYLLTMCEDTNFLDKADVLIEWLGFPLRRNPFITRDRLDQCDDRPPSRPETQGGSSNNHQPLTRLPTLHMRCPYDATPRSTSEHTRAKRPPPPASLVLPLASILPCDNAVDGRRVSAAQLVLLEEESIHGKMGLLQTARQIVESCQRLARAVGDLSEEDRNSGSNEAALYGRIAAVHTRIRRNEKAVARVRQARVEASRILVELDGHILWIENCRQEDREREHHIWSCRNRYRQDAVKSCASLSTRLQDVIAHLDHDMERLHAAVTSQHQLAETLEQEKERRLRARKLLQQQQRESRLPVPVKRSMHLKRPSHSPSSSKPVKRSVGAVALTRLSRVPQLDPQLETSVTVTLHECSSQNVRDLEKKRAAAIKERAAMLREKAARDKTARTELDRRRAESVLMKAEDDASHEQQRLMETRQRLQQRRALFDRISATAIFKCTHEMNGKTFLISIYEQKPRGYILEGIRVAAYDPVTSSTFSLVLTLHQFDSYGYGWSREGLRAFCRWLCLLYEKRRRRFRLVWVGSPCPPPLRIREYDCTLVCAHKEGVKLSGQAGYALVAVYVRSDVPDTLRFVCGSLSQSSESLVERPIRARELFAPEDFEIVDKETEDGIECMIWRHHRETSSGQPEANSGYQSDTFLRESTEGWNECSHVYSGTMVMDGARVDAHIYDVNSTEYIIDADCFSQLSTHTSTESSATVDASTGELSMLRHHRRVVLLKRRVNPYPLVLPPDSFDDLLACVTFEPVDSGAVKHGDDNTGASALAWKADVSRKWEEKLAKYIRVLRLTRFGCKMAGTFCFVTMYLVQLKTKYRAHLLLEVTPLSTPKGDGTSTAKQSLYVNLSDYLRCEAATRRLRLTNDKDATSYECRRCARRQPVSEHESSHQLHQGQNAQQLHFQESAGIPASCPGCVAAQTARTVALHDVLAPLVPGHNVTWSAEHVDMMVRIIHRELCETCGAALPPLLIAIGPELSSHQIQLSLSLASFYLSCFDFRELVSSARDSGCGTQYEPKAADTFKQSVAHNRATVLLNADFGLTVAGANGFVHELHALLYPDAHELPFQVLYVMKSGGTTRPSIHTTRECRDHGVIAAVAAMQEAAAQIGEGPLVHMGDTAEASDNGLGFDGYLVTEALLMEAIRIVLEPNESWRKPGGTVGSSSWPVACELLRNIKYLSHELQLRDVLGFSATTQDSLFAYFSHESWPHSYDDVRPIFHMILAFMMHVEHVYQLVADSGGLLGSNTLNPDASSSSTAATEHSDGRAEWNLHSQSSVLLL